MNPHGEFRNYDELQAILRRVADDRGLSRETIDELAGLPRGYAGKTLSPVPMRKLGHDTLGPMVGALGVKFIAVDDPEAMAQFTARGDERSEKYALNGAMRSGAVHFKISLLKLKQNGRKGGKNSRKFVNKRRRRKLARQAALARWRKRRTKRRGATRRKTCQARGDALKRRARIQQPRGIAPTPPQLRQTKSQKLV